MAKKKEEKGLEKYPKLPMVRRDVQSVYFPPELLTQIRRIAKKEKRPISNQIIYFVEKGMSK